MIAPSLTNGSSAVFGGRGITVGGMGVFIEQFQRTFKFDAVLGGSEEVSKAVYRLVNPRLMRL